MDITTWSEILPNLDFLDITFLVGFGVGSCLIWIIIDLKILQTILLPTIEELKNNLFVPKNCALFYSGPGSYTYKARQWAKRKEGGHMVLSQLWRNLRYPSLWQNDAGLSEEFFALASRAIAELASVTVHGTNWWRGTMWDLYEWPHLSSDVTEVIRMNPDYDHEQTIKGGAVRPQRRIQRHRQGCQCGQSWRRRRHRHARRCWRRRARWQQMAA